MKTNLIIPKWGLMVMLAASLIGSYFLIKQLMNLD